MPGVPDLFSVIRMICVGFGLGRGVVVGRVVGGALCLVKVAFFHVLGDGGPWAPFLYLWFLAQLLSAMKGLGYKGGLGSFHVILEHT